MRRTSGLVSLSRPPRVRCHLLPPLQGPRGLSRLSFPAVPVAHLTNGAAVFRILAVPLWTGKWKEDLKIERSRRKTRGQEVGSKKIRFHKRHKKLQNVCKR